MPFSLRRLTLDDMDRAAIIFRTSFDERLPWLAGLHTPEQDRAYFHAHVFSTCEVWGAIDHDIVGIIALRSGWIDQLYVLPSHQGRGVGAAFLDLAKARSESLQLWTFQSNPAALRFYESKSFVAVQQTDGSANDEREPDILYRWDRRSNPPGDNE